MKKPFFVVIAASVALAGPVFAQDTVESQHIVLKVDAGSILTSTGGEFQSAVSGQQLSSDDKLMVNTGSAAKVVYDRGNTDPKDDCVIEFKKPGVYDVPDDCHRAVAWVGGGSQVGNAAIIVGSAVVAALLIGNSSDNNHPTMSLGNR